MNRRSHALALAKRFRTCPTPDITGLPETHPKMAAHRRCCPLCALQGSDDPWQAITRQICSLEAERAKSVSRPVAPGDLVAVKPQRGRWVGDLFYRPPLVVILADSSLIPGAVEVAQVYHDPLLAGPGDLIIEDPESPLGPFFVECWNAYTLGRQDLDVPVLRLPDDRLEAALAVGRDPSALPHWAPLPIPVTAQNDPRLAFRRMEVEVGLVFAAATAEGVVDRIDSVGLESASVHEVREALRRLVPEVRWGAKPDNAEHALAVAELPSEFYPLAAAGEGVALWGRRVELVKGRPARISPFTPRLDRVEALGENRIGISGRIAAEIRPGQRTKLLATLILPVQPSIWCDTVDWDPRGGHFYLEVPTADIGLARIELTLVVVEGGDA